MRSMFGKLKKKALPWETKSALVFPFKTCNPHIVPLFLFMRNKVGWFVFFNVCGACKVKQQDSQRS